MQIGAQPTWASGIGGCLGCQRRLTAASGSGTYSFMRTPNRTPEPPASLPAILGALTKGTVKPVYLFAGEPFQTTAAAKALIDVLVPESNRAFNLETYDGRTTPWARVLDSLRMRGFFAGPKVVWVRETTVFLSGEKRGDVAKRLFAAWADGDEQEAAEKLLSLVALAGWTQEQFAACDWSALSKTRLKEVFGEELDAAQQAQLPRVQSVCLARDLTVSAFQDDGANLLAALEGETLPQVVLVLTASTVDARKRLYKRIAEVGTVLDLSAARERSGALSRETVDELVSGLLADHGKRLDPQARELVLRRAGTDSGSVAAEIEKLCLSVGNRPNITADDVRDTMLDLAESWIFDFTSALSSCQAATAVGLLRDLMKQGEPALRLLAMIARETRLLLVARECLDGSLRGLFRPDLPYPAFQSRVLPKIDPETMAAFGKAHPFVIFKRLQDAARLSSQSLRRALIRLSDIDLRLKSTRTDPALLLEQFVVDWCRTPTRVVKR